MLAFLTFVVIFVLLGSGLLLLFYREAMIRRISEVINPQPKQRSLIETLQQTGSSLSGVVEHFEQVLPKSQAEIGVAQQRLVRAGFREEHAIKILYGAKVLLPLILLGTVFATGIASKNMFMAIAFSVGGGFLIPDFYLGHLISKRQKAIHRGLPDVLDLLVICIEAGLSLDHAAARTAQELRKAQPELCDELGIVVLEQRAGRPRAEAWRHMAERTDVDAIRNLVTMLIQSEQLGTSIGKTLRVHSDTLRSQRVQAVEEAAAKLSVKLLFPLVFFIFPALFVVVLAPAMISIMDSFKVLNGH